VDARESRLRAALVGAIIGTLALALIIVALAKRPAAAVDVRTKDRSTATAPTMPPRISSPTTQPTPPQTTLTAEEPRSVDDLEHQFLGMCSSLSPRDRRAALRALYARIDTGGGSADERARRKHDALIELIRQHAN
ncbi:MAG: hypothetical protein JWM53_4453, partial [bacterium]|nr:hypothetical protein [bacterium]